MMRLVQNLGEIQHNMQVIDSYLEKRAEPTYSYAVDLIKNGRCFIAVRSGSGYRFYPSRFIGYAQNSKERHENNDEKDGKETNPVISHILDQQLSMDLELEQFYDDYCKELGLVTTTQYKRKYWKL